MFETVVLEPTLRCNLACPMCDRARSLRRSASWSREQCLRIALGIPSSTRRVVISGGEPTCYPHLLPLVEILLGRGFGVNLLTNGTRTGVVERLVGLGVNSFNFSVDGPRPLHDQIRGPGRFDRTAASIRRAREAGASVVTTTVVSEHNVLGLPGIFADMRRHRLRPNAMFFEFARRFDAATVRRSAALLGLPESDVAVNVSTSAFAPFPESMLLGCVEHLVRLARSYRRKIQFLPDWFDRDPSSLHRRDNRSRYCLRCTHRGVLRIAPTGQVVPCFTFRSPLGDPVRDGIEAVVGGQAWRAFWDRLEGANLTPACETCFRAERVGPAVRENLET